VGRTGVGDLGEGRGGELLGYVDLLEDLTRDGGLSNGQRCKYACPATFSYSLLVSLVPPS
jgi:hypothetical protein